MKKPQPIPLEVPWMVSPSTPFLRLFATEQENTYVEFVAYYKCEESPTWQSSGTGIQVVKPPSTFHAADTGHGPHRLVRLVFEWGIWVKLSPAFSDKEVVPEAGFDWSAVSGRWSPGEDIGGFLKRSQEEWLRSGICPDPNVYEINGSQWLEETGAAHDKHNQWRHYLILGHDAYAEVIAKGFVIHEGQVLSG
jgi:hypothetical protein